jgi:hypothetical protein
MGILRRNLFALFCLLALLTPSPSHAQDIPVQEPGSSMPANTQDGEFSAFDLVVGGNVYGAVYGNFGPDWFEPAAPEDILTIFPAVRDPNAFLPLFKGRIEKIRTVRGVGTVHVDTNNFQISVDVDQEQTVLAAVQGVNDLKGSEKGVALRNTLFVAGSSDTQNINFIDGSSLTHTTVLSRGSAALQSSGTLTRQNGYDLQTALVRKDFKAKSMDFTAYGGLLQTEGNMRFARSLDYSGARIATNQDLLFRDEQLQGSDIEIFLPRRAQVKIFRDSQASGQVLYSRSLDFGTVQIDTRAFPQGSYDIEIVVFDGATVLSRETRPFIKNQTLPPRGKPVISLDLGETRQDTTSLGNPVAEASVRARLTDWLGGSLGLAATDTDQVYEAGLQTQKGLPLFKTMGLLETSLTGAFAKSDPAGAEATLSWTSDKAALSLSANKTYRRTGAALGAGGFALTDRQSVNANFSMPFTAWNERFFFNLNGELSNSSAGGRQYHYGPSLSHTFDQIGTYTPEVKLEYTASNANNSILATFVLRDTDPVWTKNAELDMSKVGRDSSATAVTSLGFTGRNSAYSDWIKKLDANLGLRMDPLYSSVRQSEAIVSGDMQYTGDFARVKGFADQSVMRDNGGQAGGELESTLVWSPGSGLRATSQGAGSDMALLMVTLLGDVPAEFNITMNGMPRTVVKTGETAVLSLPVYEQVRIGAADTQSGGTLKVKEKDQVIVGYPGNVAYREFTVVKSWIIMGTLNDENAVPMAGARFTLNGNIYYTDETGFFTLEESAGAGDTLAFEGEDFSCQGKMPEADKDATLAEIGTVFCQKKTPASC